MIREELNQARIAVTGSTGFLGTALVERLLRGAPECELVLIVRPGRRGAQHRVDRDILRNDAFDRLRKEQQARIDAGDGLAQLATCDIAIHSAATVSFDSALDDAVAMIESREAALALAASLSSGN